MIYQPRKPQKLGAEAREAERSILEEIEELANKAVDNCPECGSADYHRVEGCSSAGLADFPLAECIRER